LSNAVKFTGHGSVGVRISLAPGRRGDGQACVEFTVADTGIGIAEESLATIFGAFQQGDGTTSRRYGGTGLGLAISREVAAQLGGRITVKSSLDAGSTFTLYLPISVDGLVEGTVLPVTSLADGATDATLRRPATGAPSADGASGIIQPVTRPAGHESLRGRRVLIVDDDPRNVFALTGVLELYGLTVIHADDGEHGIEALKGGGIDLVLMDVMMPQLDGYATTRAIREMPQFADLPVIAVTARAMAGDRDKSIAAGASDYVTKPVDTEQLLTCMERWLSR
ncbi:MAG TPA: response regulator, partial [Streptosporangiaceae bacterium]|nr:response regulator [Streptosporangiaceae bacterium]